MKGKVVLLSSKVLPLLLWLLLLLVLWEALSWVLLHQLQVPLAQSRLPYIHKLAAAFIDYRSSLLKEGVATLGNAGIGFVLGAAAGAGLAVLMSLSRWVGYAALPYAVASQMIPVLGLAPIIYGIVRDEELARVLISGYITFFPVAINMLRGLNSVAPSQLDLMTSCAARPWQMYWKLRLPSALPALFSGLKIAAPLAVTGAILVELMGARHGIGIMMLRNLYYGSSHAYMFWCTVIFSALLGLVSYLLIVLIERIAAPWQPEFRGGGGGEAA